MAITVTNTLNQTIFPSKSYAGIPFSIVSTASNLEYIVATLQIYGAAGYETIAQFTQYEDLNTSGTFYVNVQDICSKYLKRHSPTINGGVAEFAIDMTKQFRIYFTERVTSGNTIIDGLTSSNTTFYVTNAAIQYDSVRKHLSPYLMVITAYTGYSTELLINGNFHLGESFWGKWDYGTVGNLPTLVGTHPNAYYAIVSQTEANGDTVANYINQDCNFVNGKTYLISFNSVNYQVISGSPRSPVLITNPTNKIVNGTFETSGTWTNGGDASSSISGGKAHLAVSTAGQTSSIIRQTVSSLKNTKKHLLSFNITNYQNTGSNETKVTFTNTDLGTWNVTKNGYYSKVITTSSTSGLLEFIANDVTNSGTLTMDIDNVSLVEVAMEFSTSGAQSLEFTSDGNDSEVRIQAVASAELAAILYTPVNQFSVLEKTGYVWSPNIDDPYRFMTNAPMTKHIRIGESEYFDAYRYSDYIDHLRVYFYDKTNTLVKQTTIMMDTTADNRYHIPVGTANIEAATLTSGSKPAFTSSITSYEVVLEDDTNANVSEIRKFKIDKRCNDNSVRFHFMNRLGGMDSFTAMGKYMRGIDVKDEQYEKVLPSDYTIGDRVKEELKINAKNLFVINTGAITRETAIWLMELMTSPQVFIQKYVPQDDEYYYIPIIITNKNKIEVSYSKNIQSFDIEYIEGWDILIPTN